jgi:hypothetical protein
MNSHQSRCYTIRHRRTFRNSNRQNLAILGSANLVEDNYNNRRRIAFLRPSNCRCGGLGAAFADVEIHSNHHRFLPDNMWRALPSSLLLALSSPDRPVVRKPRHSLLESALRSLA